MLEDPSPSERAEERLLNILYGDPDGRIAYIYALDEKRNLIKPYLDKLSPSPDLYEIIRDLYVGGHFKVMIREGRKLIFSGNISIEAFPETRQHRQ